MKKYTIEEIKKISPKVLLKIIQKAKNAIKKNKIFKDMCKECNVNPEIIDIIPMKFGDIKVSANTSHGIITLNYKLLCDGDFLKDHMYIIHECKHYLDQCYGDGPTVGANDGDYLHNEDEQSAFQKQIEYIDDQFGEDKAEEYTDHLLDYHEKDGKERKNLKEKLMKEID